MGNYYTLDKIPIYRLRFIDSKIKEFITSYSITEWPLDCVAIIQKIRDDKLLPLKLDFTRHVDKKFDALSRYIEDNNIIQIVFNRNKIRYPFLCSKHRRFNFTVAHELGHIMLKHLDIPDLQKNTQEKALEDMEADEFAGRLLMPKDLLYSCNFRSAALVAKYFNVSISALWKRLNNLKRLDFLKKKGVPTCPVCGNTQFSMFAEYCGICGQSLDLGRDGILKVRYPVELPVNNYNQVVECPICKTSRFMHVDKCTRCNTYIYNYCTGYSDNTCDHSNLSRSRFCEMCGKPTYYFKRGFLLPWKDIDIIRGAV
jgi:hypothetical protein